MDVMPTTCYVEKLLEVYPGLKDSNIKNCQGLVSKFNLVMNGLICNAWWSKSGICDPMTPGQVRTTCQRSCGICDRGSDS